jgi:hypothetical protein
MLPLVLCRISGKARDDQCWSIRTSTAITCREPRAAREPWLVIDPKPLVGEREFSLAAVPRGESAYGVKCLKLRNFSENNEVTVTSITNYCGNLPAPTCVCLP